MTTFFFLAFLIKAVLFVNVILYVNLKNKINVLTKTIKNISEREYDEIRNIEERIFGKINFCADEIRNIANVVSDEFKKSKNTFDKILAKCNLAEPIIEKKIEQLLALNENKNKRIFKKEKEIFSHRAINNDEII